MRTFNKNFAAMLVAAVAFGWAGQAAIVLSLSASPASAQSKALDIGDEQAANKMSSACRANCRFGDDSFRHGFF